jgi:hypothetical protein
VYHGVLIAMERLQYLHVLNVGERVDLQKGQCSSSWDDWLRMQQNTIPDGDTASLV